MDDATRIRDDEFAEMELRILVALYDAGPDAATVRPGAVYRPAARYTGLGEALHVMEGLVGRGVTGMVGAVGLVGAKLDPAVRRRLDGADARGTRWIARARAVIAEAARPRIGHASAVRDELRG